MLHLRFPIDEPKPLFILRNELLLAKRGNSIEINGNKFLKSL